MLSIAYKTLVADRGKLVTALVGVIFSVVLVNVQGGLFVGLIRKASLLIDQGDADIWVGHKQMENVDFAHDIPKSWVQRIRTIPGVERAEPYQVGYAMMTLPDGGFAWVIVVGCDPSSLLGANSKVMGKNQHLIRHPDSVIVDIHDAHLLGNPQLGDIREIGGRRARVIAYSKGVVGFLITPYVFTTFDRAVAYLHKRPEKASYFLVRLEPGFDSEEICARIQERLPDTEAYTRNHYATLSILYWIKNAGLGISFGASTALGLIVGLIIVSQTLYASVLDRLAEFGALKAMGASERQIHAVVLFQALLLAFVGSAVGVIGARVMQDVFSTPRAAISIPWYLYVGSCMLVTFICMVSSLLPYWRIRQIDPAMVLQN